MALFEHYMYVLTCGDGSLYTGYTPNVEARLAAHQAGTGAKYTKAHAPVALAAQARFFSKARAMSAEALFKQLSRSQKDALLARAQKEPFEQVLSEQLFGLGADSAAEFVCRNLSKNIDEAYREFQGKLIPTVDARSFAGVRTPVLRKIAKELMKREDASTFLRALPHHSFDETQVHAFAIGQVKEYKKAVKLIEKFLPHVDNWATCDQLPTKILAERPDETLDLVSHWLESDHCYTKRFAIGVLMQHFLDELFDPRFLDLVAQADYSAQAKAAGISEPDRYYLDMMRAWYFAEALAKQEKHALPYFENKGNLVLLDEWTRKKAIQKAIESRRISPQLKERLRKWRYNKI